MDRDCVKLEASFGCNLGLEFLLGTLLLTRLKKGIKSHDKILNYFYLYSDGYNDNMAFESSLCDGK